MEHTPRDSAGGAPPPGKNRVVVIGLDSCDPDLLLRWSGEGRLPFLTSLMETGVWARLLSTRGLFSDSPWPSFNTGVNPGKHGHYNYLTLRCGTNEIFRSSGRYCQYLPFWSLLRDRGTRTAVLDVPKTFPVPGVDGIQATAWGEHYPLLRRSSLPVELVRELDAKFGTYPHPSEVIDPRLSQEVQLYRTMLANVDRKLRATQYLLEQDDWDLFISVFAEAHYGGHQLLHHADATHWAHDPKAAGLLGDSLARIYTRLDEALAELCEALPADTTLFIVSVHGVATNYSGNDLMPAAMEGLGFQIPNSEGGGGGGFGARARGLAGKLRNLVPPEARSFVNERVLPESVSDRMYARYFAASFDWQRSRAFFLPSDHFQGFIRVNMRGREPWGVVERGAEYDEVCDEICRELRRLINPSTGTPAIQEVVRIQQTYAGAALDTLPDLVIRWADDAPISALSHPCFGTIRREHFKLRKTQHGPDGFVIATGKHINPQATVTGGSTLDMAPTILHLLGQPIPRDMDGRVLGELLDDDFTRSHPCVYEDTPFVVSEEMRV